MKPYRIVPRLVVVSVCCGAWANDPPKPQAASAAAVKLTDSPLALPDSAASLGFDWSVLKAGRATVSVLNKSGDTVNVTAPPVPMSCPSPCTNQSFAVTPPSASIGSYRTAVFTVTVPADALPGDYSGTFSLVGDSKTTAPFLQPVWVKPAVSKVAAALYRDSPCGRCFSSPDAMVAGSGPGTGALVSDNGNAVLAHWKQTAEGMRLQFDGPPAAGVYKGDMPWGPPSAKTSVAVTLTVSDLVVYPLIVILLGTTLAYLVKRYLGVSRITLDLRRRDAELGELWQRNRRLFLSTVRHPPLSGYSLAADITAKRTQIHDALKNIDRQWLLSSLDDKDADYQTALTNITALQTAIAAWPDFGSALIKLAGVLRNARDTIQVADLVPPDPRLAVPAFAKVARSLLAGSEITTDVFLTSRQSVTDETTFTINWIAAYNLLKNTTGRFRDIDPRSLSDPQKAIQQAIEPRLVSAWKHLFDAVKQADLDAVVASGSDGDAAEVAVRQLEDQIAVSMDRLRMPSRIVTFGLAGPLFSRLPDLDLDTTTSPQPAVDDRARARMLRDRIRRDDVLSFFFAVAIAVLTGLNTYYLALPFGSLKDYVGLFLWAAATKATLDILSAVLDKMAPLQTAPPPKPAS